MLHLGLTLAGSRSSSVKSLNLVGWASLPFAVRYLLQAGYILFHPQPDLLAGAFGIQPAGLASLSAFLTQVDIYLVWQIALLFIGVPLIAGMSRRKAWLVTTVVLVILLCLAALPAICRIQAGRRRPRPTVLFLGF